MRFTRFLSLSVAAAILLAGCATTATTTPQSSQPPSPSATEPSATEPAPSPSEAFTAGAPEGQCLTANIAVSVAEADASAGHLHYVVTFTNKGEACVLKGFPTFQVTRDGAPLGLVAEDDSSAVPALVTLAAGGTAVAALTAINLGFDGGPLGDACAILEGNAVSVTPPHSTIAIPVTPLNFMACANDVPWMTIGPISPS
ncbi:MAG: DUF4232 domain-containing protein [Terrimesophilobacter sp.]